MNDVARTWVPSGDAAAASSEQGWIERAASGDAQAVGALYQMHQQAVRAFAQRLLGDHESAEDLVQDVFVALPGLLRGFEGRSALRTFLLGVAANRCRKHLRSAARRRNMLERAKRETAGVEAGPDGHLWRTQQAHALSRALDRLPVRQRVAFVLVAVEQRSHAEAASLLGLPEATVRTRCFHARKTLRKLLREVRP